MILDNFRTILDTRQEQDVNHWEIIAKVSKIYHLLQNPCKSHESYEIRAFWTPHSKNTMNPSKITHSGMASGRLG